MGNEFLKMINTRRSCRKYRKEQITDEELNAILVRMHQLAWGSNPLISWLSKIRK